MSGKTILIAEDENCLRESLAELLTDKGYQVTQACDGQQAYEAILQRTFDLVLTDIRMPQMDGITLLGHLQEIQPQTPVIVSTAYGTIENAVDAMSKGALDYLLKPVNFDDLLIKIQRALDFGDMQTTHRVVTEQLASQHTFHNLIGSSPSMLKLFQMVRKLSQVKSSVLIVGESGTGKELFARAIHYNGLLKSKPFIAVNCGAIPESLIESELFGHRRGSFTGAHRDKTGYFEAANGGTLFLDEISTLPLSVQSALLRVLEDRTVTPVGDTTPRSVDLRVIAASNKDLEKMVHDNEFREDLMYRLNVVKLELPPLRERKEDIPILAHYFLEKYAREMNHKVEMISNDAMHAILTHSWRGNVRELENVIERAVIFAENGQITLHELPFAQEPSTAMATSSNQNLKDAMRQFERQHILACLNRNGYDKIQTAQCLGIGVSSLYRKIDELDIPKDLVTPGGDADQAT